MKNHSSAFTAFRLFLLLLLGSAGWLMTACKDEEKVVAKDYSGIDDQIIQKFIADSAITTAQKQPSGLYYVPLRTNPAAVRATAGKTVYVKYVGRFMDNRVFDSSGSAASPFVLSRGQIIDGWVEGIALMHKGDKAKLLIPSALAYGASGRGPIPPYTVIRFDVELVDVL
ncbi:MAG TPA: FKBP-type peptidyl-prolyl cis-trans isomerase [Hymenobacter sp.]